MNKVLLINSPNRRSEPPRHYPYGLGIITAILEMQGLDVTTFDGNFQSLEDLDRLLKEERFDFVGISGIVTTFAYQKTVIQLVKASNPNSVIGSGGGLACAVGAELLEILTDLDVVFIGEGEKSSVEFVVHFESSPEGVKGIAYRDGARIIKNENAPLLDDLDAVPWPELDKWHVDKYFANKSFPLSPSSSTAARRGNVLTSRGCPYKCDFCFNILGRHHARYRSSDSVLAEIDALLNKYRVDFITFLDESFLINKTLVSEIAELIEHRGWRFRWGVAARPTSTTPEILRQIKRAGCDFIHYGFDSGSQRTLERMNKRMTVDDNIQAFKMAVEAGIYPVPNIIIGYDNETLENIHENYTFFQQLIDYGRSIRSEKEKEIFQRGFNNFGAIYLATPYPGSELFKRNKHKLPQMEDLLTRMSFKDAYELSINVSRMDDETLLSEQEKMERYVRSFTL